MFCRKHTVYSAYRIILYKCVLCFVEDTLIICYQNHAVYTVYILILTLTCFMFWVGHTGYCAVIVITDLDLDLFYLILTLTYFMFCRGHTGYAAKCGGPGADILPKWGGTAPQQ